MFKSKTKSAILFLFAILLSFGFQNDETANDSKKKNIKTGTAVGEKAPDIVLNDPEGKEISLYSLRGKVVLIDFWASWCRPCRMENPNVVAAYKKYSKAKLKDAKGFEVFSVSLDKNQGHWKNAIKQDKLDWDYHVSDLKGWSSAPGKEYGVRAIPTNWLIDADGVIIDKNLRGIQLHKTLDELVEKL